MTQPESASVKASFTRRLVPNSELNRCYQLQSHVLGKMPNWHSIVFPALKKRMLKPLPLPFASSLSLSLSLSTKHSCVWTQVQVRLIQLPEKLQPCTGYYPKDQVTHQFVTQAVRWTDESWTKSGTEKKKNEMTIVRTRGEDKGCKLERRKLDIIGHSRT